MYKLISFIVALLLALGNQVKVDLCHHDEGQGGPNHNGYNIMNVSIHSVNDANGVGGHGNHELDSWTSFVFDGVTYPGHGDFPGPCGEPETDTPTPVTPTDTPTATEPTDTPTATEPTDTPTATEPTDTPTPTEPTDTPTATEPTDTPTATEPTDTPTATEPTATELPPTGIPPIVKPTKTPEPPACQIEVQAWIVRADLPMGVEYVAIAWDGAPLTGINDPHQGKVATFFTHGAGQLMLIQPEGHQAAFLALTTAGGEAGDANAYVVGCTGYAFLNAYGAGPDFPFMGHLALQNNGEVQKGFWAPQSHKPGAVGFLDLGIMP